MAANTEKGSAAGYLCSKRLTPWIRHGCRETWLLPQPRLNRVKPAKWRLQACFLGEFWGGRGRMANLEKEGWDCFALRQGLTLGALHALNSRLSLQIARITVMNHCACGFDESPARVCLGECQEDVPTPPFLTEHSCCSC